MKLLRLKADGFGALRGEFRFDPERLTVVLDDNERGKSTLLAAIAAALYGLDGDRRSHRLLTPLERWKPWDGGSFRVELELETEGRRLTVSRDFDRGTVAVWSDRGQDVTAEFRDGRDEFPVGHKLLDLDAEEFERCAMVRQGDLLQVIPSEERDRRSPSLRAKLEAVADSRVGDARASEAIKILDGALRRYTCAELDFTGTAENAIARLEAKRELIETELRELAHDLDRNAGPLEELADIGEAERQAREGLAGLDAEWRSVLAGDAQARLEQDRRAEAEVQELRREAESLAALAELPADSESLLRDTVARLDEAQRNVAALEGRRHEEVSRERGALESERESLKAFESGGAAEADRCVSLAAEIRRAGEAEGRLREEIYALRESLATEGHDPERLQWLANRLGRLSEADHPVLRRQSELALAHHTETAGLESQRTTSSEVLREIDQQRGRRTLPGWFLLSLGIAILVAGVVVVALQGLPWLSWSFFVLGALGLGAGVALVHMGGQLRGREREEALQLLAEAQRRLNQLRQQRAETENALEALAREHGYRDHVELLREWNEWMRLRDESATTLQAQRELAATEARRKQATEEARELLGRFGIRTPEPENLEKVAALLRQLEGVRHKLTALDRNWSWIDEQKRVDEASASGLKQRAMGILQAAGLGYDPARSWEEHLAELAERLKGRQRWATLTRELIPAAERRRLSEAQRAELESQRALAEGAPISGTRRGQRDIDAERRRLQEKLEDVQRRRADLRVEVEETWRRVQAERPEKLAQLERIERALHRAKRFKEAVDLALKTIHEVAAETHQRWADYLNRRVGELIAGIGAGIEQIRFGDDLDFSVRLAGGQPLSRGKADQQLSAGTRDQLYLAVRLAVSEFLSRGQTSLPLLLDDVFVTSDDERARAGMRLLIERFTAAHQVIVLTCHRQRFERLGEMDRDLYLSRVQWLDTRSAGITGAGR